MEIELNYKLTGTGWAECYIEIYGRFCKVTASYLSDALGDLVSAVNYIFNSEYEIKSSFTEEPGEYRWILIPQKNNGLQIKIIDFPQTWNQKPDEEGELMFDVTVSKYEFSLAILNMLETLLSEYGVLEYKKQWVKHDFPVGDYRSLCIKLGRKPMKCLFM